jgi:hypothetical protein
MWVSRPLRDDPLDNLFDDPDPFKKHLLLDVELWPYFDPAPASVNNLHPTLKTELIDSFSFEWIIKDKAGHEAFAMDLDRQA